MGLKMDMARHCVYKLDGDCKKYDSLGEIERILYLTELYTKSEDVAVKKYVRKFIPFED